jgi:phage/plasmid-like protein (TIGR03299 family)
MAHGIVKGIDKGIVGYVDVYGGTWHQFKEYKQINGAVSFAEALDCLGYEVEKRQVHFPATTPQGEQYVPVDNVFMLVRTDSQKAVHNISVTDEYEVYQNTEFLEKMRDGIMKSNPDLSIESCGSLWAGRLAFVNFLLKKFVVKGDKSETISRLMYYNAFGGRSISACAHNTRIVCNNTLMMAEAQGFANATLGKFKHTSGAPKRVEDHLVELTKLLLCVDKHKEQLDRMAEQQMKAREVEHFLGGMFEVEEDDSAKTKSTRVNKRNEILKIFESGEDLQGVIARTRYAMLQSVTAYQQHNTLSKDMDETSTWFDVVSGGGRHKMNRKAWDLLTQDEIPVPKGAVAVADLVEATNPN